MFTDVDCPYCRKLHSQIAEYNRLGVRVRYMLYPRTGPNTESWTKAEQVWCSADRNDALTRAKLGQELEDQALRQQPGGAQLRSSARTSRSQGTPAIIMPNGECVAGYMPPDALLEHLKEAHP